jgi:hypothetical protein
VKKQLESNGRAQDLREIACGNGNFTADPQKDRSAPRIMLSAGLRKVAPCGNAQLGGERLQKHGNQTAE